MLVRLSQASMDLLLEILKPVCPVFPVQMEASIQSLCKIKYIWILTTSSPPCKKFAERQFSNMSISLVNYMHPRYYMSDATSWIEEYCFYGRDEDGFDYLSIGLYG